MRRSMFGATWILRAMMLVLVLVLVLAQVQSDAAPPRKKKTETISLKVEETVGDLAFVQQMSEIKVMGIGLVTGLENTGSDPPPSWERTQLVDEMSKAGVEHPSKLLGNPQFSMVIVKMTIRAGASPKDRFDVDVEVPPACGTKSLAGGYLLTTRLHETLLAGGAPRNGTDLAIAQGPVMIGNAKKPSDLKVGRVLGGGRVKKETPYMLVIKEKRKSIRTAQILEKVVNERFHQSEAGEQKGACTAKSDGYLVLRVPTAYHQNQERYFRVVQLMPMVDTPTLRSQRTATWGKDLLDPKTSGVAALKLEGLGPTASETLQAGLKSSDENVRFFAAEALAYLDDPSGADALGETAIHLPKFRAYALAALAAMDQSAAHVKLRILMNEPDNELRYGAFNALRTLDPHDPSLGSVRVLDDPQVDEQQDEPQDSMAVALTATSRPRADDPFAFYIVDSEGPPAVHISRTRRSEIVVFGRSQRLLPPIVLGTGAILLNAAEKDDEIEISKIVPSKFKDSDVKLRTSLDLPEVIRRVANLGATYPEMVAILEAANKQRNLPGVLIVDAVPQSNMDYLEAAILGKDTKSKVDPALQRASHRPTSRIWRLFGSRDADVSNRPANQSGSSRKDPSSTAETASAEHDSGRTTASKASPAEGADAAQASASPPSGGAQPDSNSAPAATAQKVPKKDDGLQRAGGDDQSDPPPRSRLLDWLRRRFDDSPS